MITVGIPTKNCIPQINRAIESVLDQSGIDFEILIVNDSGNEKLPNLVSLIEEYGDKIRVVHHKENLGIGKARNTIIDNASGEYIMFLSDDDCLLPNSLSKFLKTAKENPNSIIYSSYQVIDINGDIVQQVRIQRSPNKELLKERTIEFANHDSMFICYNFFAPTELLMKNRFDSKLRFGEDLEHLLRCMFIEDINFIGIEDFLFQYSIHMNSTSTLKRNEIHENDNKIRKQINKLANRRIFDE